MKKKSKNKKDNPAQQPKVKTSHRSKDSNTRRKLKICRTPVRYLILEPTITAFDRPYLRLIEEIKSATSLVPLPSGTKNEELQQKAADASQEKIIQSSMQDPADEELQKIEYTAEETNQKTTAAKGVSPRKASEEEQIDTVNPKKPAGVFQEQIELMRQRELVPQGSGTTQFQRMRFETDDPEANVKEVSDRRFKSILGNGFRKLVEEDANKSKQKALEAWIWPRRKEAGTFKGKLSYDKYAEINKFWINNTERPILNWSFHQKAYREHVRNLAPASYQVDPVLIDFILSMPKEVLTVFNKRLGSVDKMQKYVSEDVKDWTLCSVCCGRGVLGQSKHQIRECMKVKNSKYCILRIEDRYVCPICLCLADSMIEMVAHLAFHNWRDLALFGISKEHCLKIFESDQDAIRKDFPQYHLVWDNLVPLACHATKLGCEGRFKALENFIPLEQSLVLRHAKAEDPYENGNVHEETKEQPKKPQNMGEAKKSMNNMNKFLATPLLPQLSGTNMYPAVATVREKLVVGYPLSLVENIPGGNLTIADCLGLQNKFASSAEQYEYFNVSLMRWTTNGYELCYDLNMGKKLVYLKSLASRTFMAKLQQSYGLFKYYTSMRRIFLQSLKNDLLNTDFWKPGCWFFITEERMINISTCGWMKNESIASYERRRTWINQKYDSQKKWYQYEVVKDFLMQYFCCLYLCTLNQQFGQYPNIRDYSGRKQFKQHYIVIMQFFIQAGKCAQLKKAEQELIEKWLDIDFELLSFSEISGEFNILAKIVGDLAGKWQHFHVVPKDGRFKKCGKGCVFFRPQRQAQDSSQECGDQSEQAQFEIIESGKFLFKLIKPEYFEKQDQGNDKYTFEVFYALVGDECDVQAKKKRKKPEHSKKEMVQLVKL